MLMIFLFLDSVGGGELMVIMLFILMFFGSKKIPELARGLGKGMREMKDAMNGVQSEIRQSINEVENTIKAEANKISEPVKPSEASTPIKVEEPVNSIKVTESATKETQTGE